METLTIIIPERMTGDRLDVALSKMLPDYSRSKITVWIEFQCQQAPLESDR